MRPRARLAIALGTALLLCVACGKRTVPFKRDGTEAAAPGAPDAGSALPAPPPSGQTYAPSTQKIEVRGQPVALERGAIRASLELASAAPDASPVLMLLVDAADGSLALERRAFQNDAWSASERLALLIDPALERCSLEAARLSPLAIGSVAADADVRCAPPPAPKATEPAPAEVEPAPSPEPEHRLWAIAVDAPARVLQRISSLPDVAAGLVIGTALEQRDLDNDGHPDFLLKLDVRVGSDPVLPIELKLFERAGGLIREGAEPEKTLRQLADRAVAAHVKRDASAAQLARSVLLLHRSLCREPGAPKLLLDGRGLECGASLAAGRAASTLTAELARQGKLAEALQTSRSLQQPFYQLAEADSTRAQQALRARAEAGHFSWREAIQVETVRSPPARRSMLGFIDDGHVLIRGPTPRSFDLVSGRADPVGLSAGLTLIDPSGRFAIGSIRRSCDGYHLAIVRASQIVAGIVTGPSVAEPLFARAAPPPGTRCPAELAPDQRRDQGGYHTIEWTPAGVLLARDQALFLLPLDASLGSPAPASPLTSRDPVPPLTQSGELTPDGRYHIWLSSEGIAIHDRQQDAIRFLSPPTGAGPMTDVAVSPSGRMVALLRGRKLFIGALEPQAAPASP